MRKSAIKFVSTKFLSAGAKQDDAMNWFEKKFKKSPELNEKQTIQVHFHLICFSLTPACHLLPSECSFERAEEE